MTSVETNPLHFGAVILAAGASTRMGEPKQLLRIGGRTLLRRTVDAALASPAWPVVVVLGACADRISPEVARLPVLAVDNREWKEGLASSIRTGVSVLESFSLSLRAAVLLLCDQPHLSTNAIMRLAEVCDRDGKSIVATQYAKPTPGRDSGHLGPPAIFARRHFPELLELRGPDGAKSLFEKHAGVVATVSMPELDVDLDTPQDFAAARQNPY